MQPGDTGRSTQKGFTYLTVLFGLAVFGIGLAALGESWSELSRRDREQELIWIGKEYVRAIRSYYNNSPGEKRYPERLQDLLEDQRMVDGRRHLRKLYADPVNPSGSWGLVRGNDGGIMGIYSTSDQSTLRRQVIRVPDAPTIAGARYAEWRFIYLPQVREAAPVQPAH